MIEIETAYIERLSRNVPRDSEIPLSADYASSFNATRYLHTAWNKISRALATREN